MLNQPRDANGCFSRRQPGRRSSMAGTEDSWSMVGLRAFGTVLDDAQAIVDAAQRSNWCSILFLSSALIPMTNSGVSSC